MAVAAAAAAALLLRPEGGGHARRRPQPADGLDRLGDPVQARARTTCSRRPAGSAPSSTSGGVVAIAGEGRIHVRESELLPLNEGAAYFALRSGIPLVPIAINGTSWLRFGGRVRVRVGEPIAADGRPTRAAIAGADRPTPGRRSTTMVADAPELPPPGRVRALADRAVQRLARGVARGRAGRRPAARPDGTGSAPADD